MSTGRFVYGLLYGLAGTESRLHWHHQESPALLREAVERLGGRGTALDIGCGTGGDSVFMAEQGLQVTAVDFVPKALTLAAELARQRGVNIELVRTDITQFCAKKEYDLLLDSGCFHSFDEERRRRYKKRVLTLMSESAQYVLVHTANTNRLDFGLGPRSRSRDELEAFFGPELELVDFLGDADGEPSHQWMNQYRFVRSRA